MVGACGDASGTQQWGAVSASPISLGWKIGSLETLQPRSSPLLLPQLLNDWCLGVQRVPVKPVRSALGAIGAYPRGAFPSARLHTSWKVVP